MADISKLNLDTTNPSSPVYNIKDELARFERISYAQWQQMTPEQQAAKPYYIYDYPSERVIDAENVGYDNAESGLAATHVQDAIDELKSGLANLFITGHTTLVWNNYEGILTKEILGVTDCRYYIWNLRSKVWEDIIFTSSIGVNYIGVRAWEKTTPNAEQISLKQTGSLEIYWEGIYLGRSI